MTIGSVEDRVPHAEPVSGEDWLAGVVRICSPFGRVVDRRFAVAEYLANPGQLVVMFLQDYFPVVAVQAVKQVVEIDVLAVHIAADLGQKRHYM